MPGLATPEEDQQTTGQPEEATRDSALDQQGAQPLTPSESSRFDQITAGLQAAGSFVSGNKKKFLLGGGGVGIFAFLLIGFFALLPLKLEALMKNIVQRRVTDKVEFMMEKRADKLVVRFLGEKFIGNGATYTNASIVKTMYGNWAKNKFEAEFSKQSGIKIEPNTNSKGKRVSGIKVSYPDGSPPSTFQSADDLQKFIDKGTLKGLDARRFINEIARDQTKWYQVIKRRNLRMFMRNAYGIHKWSFFTGKKGPDAETEVRDSLIDDAMDPYQKDAPRIIGCASEGSDCPNDTGGADNPYGSENQAKPGSATGGGDGSLTDDTTESINDAVSKVKQYSPSQLFEKGVGKVLSKVISEELASKISSKVVPVAGQILMIDMAARVDHFFTSGNADKSLRAIHKVEYATEFSQFATIADNWKDPAKQMSGDEFNAVMNRLGDPSSSAGFQDLFLNKSGGQALDPGLGINDKATPIKDAYNAGSIVAIPVVAPLRAWYSLVDQSFLHHVIDLVNKGLGSVGALFSHIPGLSDLMNGLGGKLSGVFMALIQPAVDGTEHDGSLFSAIDAGGAVVGQDFTKNLGGHALTPAQSGALQADVVAYNTQNAPGGLFDRLFSANYTYSSANQIAATLPSSPGAAAGQAGHYLAAIVQSPLNWFMSLFNGWFAHKVDAASGRNIYGLTDNGFTDAELDQPISDAALDQATQKAALRLHISADQVTPDQVLPSDCPDGTPGTGNLCRLDLATIQSMNAEFTSNDDGGLEDGSATTSQTGQIPSGDAQTLAKQVLASSNIQLLNDALTDVQAAANGQASPITCTNGSAGASTTPLQPQLLGALLAISQKYKIGVGYITGGCHTTDSYHYSGAAADIDIVNGAPVSSATLASSNIQFGNDLAALLPSGSGIGQQQCGFKLSLASGITQFPDSCDHIHFQVPR